jgi:anti-sigma regulatory factor (Ser/Thr protein kinase)
MTILSMPSKRSSEIRRYAMDWVRGRDSDVAGALTKEFGFTRQTGNWHLSHLVRAGALIPSGRTKARTYKLGRRELLSRRYPTKDLEEHLVWADIRPYLADLPANILEICEYGMSEMINNVIDHSESAVLQVGVLAGPGVVELRIIDLGVGIFDKIQNAFGLSDPRAVVLELTKGKLTTDPASHTGEGIFFTSRAFDRFSLLSGTLFWSCTYNRRDWLLEDREAASGTYLTLEISPWSSRTLPGVIAKYSAGETGDYAFTRTEVPVLVAQFGEDNFVSRSAARRLLARLEKWREVILDFSGVTSIGPAFADEVFRVFAQQHPEVRLRPMHPTAAVSRMIHRAQNARESDSEESASAVT